MKRLRRIIFNALTALSLVLCVATVALSARSRRVADFAMTTVRTGHTNRFYSAVSCLGYVGIKVTDRWPVAIQSVELDSRFLIPQAQWQAVFPAGISASAKHWGILRVKGNDAFQTLSISDLRNERGLPMPTAPPPLPGSAVFVPHPVLASFLALPAISFFARTLRRWRTSGACAKCGYDLRATPDRCPECGTIPTELKT